MAGLGDPTLKRKGLGYEGGLPERPELAIPPQGGDPRMGGETLLIEWGGGDPRMGGGDPRMGWGIP